MCYNKLMLGAKIITKRLIKSSRKADFLHSSGYAKVQGQHKTQATGTDDAISANFMSRVSADDFATRKTLDSQRKYVQKYKNSRLMNSYYGPQRARTNQAQVEKSCGLGAKQASSKTATDVAGPRRASAGVASPRRTATGVASPRRAATWSRPKF